MHGKGLKRLMQVWTGLFGLGAAFFLFFGDLLLETGNRIGAVFFHLPPMPLPSERFWLVLTVSLMVTLTAICYTIQKDPVANRKLTLFVLISKMTSTLLFLFFFFQTRQFNYLLGSVFCDGPIFLITLLFYRAGAEDRRPVLTSPRFPQK